MAASDLVTAGDLGPEFDIGVQQPNTLRIKIGSGLANQVDGTIVVVTTPVIVDQSFLANASVTANQDVNDNGVVILTNNRTDAGWSFAANSYTYAGTPDKVRIDAMIQMEEQAGAAVARANPTLQLFRNGVLVAESASGYIRDATGHTESSNTVSFIDPSPGTNPTYQLQSRQESAEGDPVLVNIGHFSLDAVEKVTINSVVP